MKRYELLINNVDATGTSADFSNCIYIGGEHSGPFLDVNEFSSEQISALPAQMLLEMQQKLPREGYIHLVGIQLSNAANPIVKVLDENGNETGDQYTVTGSAQTAAISGWQPTYVQLEINAKHQVASATIPLDDDGDPTTPDYKIRGTVHNQVAQQVSSGLQDRSQILQMAGTAQLAQANASDQVVLSLITDGSQPEGGQIIPTADGDAAARLDESDPDPTEVTLGTGTRINTNADGGTLSGQYGRMQVSSTQMVGMIERGDSSYTGLFPQNDMPYRITPVGAWRCAVQPVDAAAVGILRSTDGSQIIEDYFNMAIQDRCYYKIDGDNSLTVHIKTDISAYSIANITLWIEEI